MDLFISLTGLFLVILQGVLAHRAGTLFNNTIVNEKGDRFLSFSRHGAMYADALILCPVMYFAVHSVDQWSLMKISIFVTLSTVVSAAMNFILYPMMATPSCHYDSQMKITPAGVVHFIFMALGVSVIGLFYLGTAQVDTNVALAISVAIAISLPFQTVVPDLAVKGRVDLLGSLQLLPLWGLIGFGYLNVTSLHWLTF